MPLVPVGGGVEGAADDELLEEVVDVGATTGADGALTGVVETGTGITGLGDL